MSTDHDSYDQQYIATHADDERAAGDARRRGRAVPRAAARAHRPVGRNRVRADRRKRRPRRADVDRGLPAEGQRPRRVDRQAGGRARHPVHRGAEGQPRHDERQRTSCARAGTAPNACAFDDVHIERASRPRDLAVRAAAVHRAEPPLWEAKGSIAGLELDLVYRQMGQPFWNWGPFGNAAKAERGGYDVFATRRRHDQGRRAHLRDRERARRARAHPRRPGGRPDPQPAGAARDVVAVRDEGRHRHQLLPPGHRRHRHRLRRQSRDQVQPGGAEGLDQLPARSRTGKTRATATTCRCAGTWT